MNQQEFISKIAPAAMEDWQAYGVPASLTIAQAILESGWGKSELATKANNLFGVKGVGPAGSYRKVSDEYVDGQKIEKASDFKKYNSWPESIRDHTEFLLKPRYAKVIGADWQTACKEVHKAGYATDPKYTDKLIERIVEYKLYEYDRGDKQMEVPILAIDAGHGGDDPGAVGNGLVEKNLTLQISNYQYARFQALGIPAALTRTTDVTLTPSQRTKLVRDSGAKYCISNHINAGGGEGVEAIYSIFSSAKLATMLAQAVADCGMKFRRVFTRSGTGGKDYYFMHRETGSVETIILEYGFIDNATDAQKLKDNWKEYAEAVVKAFCVFLGMPYTPPTSSPQKTVDKCQVYYVKGTATGFLVDGTSYVPVREIAEAAGAKVCWDAATKKVTVNDKEIAVRNEGGVSYAAARELAELLGLQVGWDAVSKTVLLKEVM